MLIGTVGVGGVLLVSFLALFGGLAIHQAAATSGSIGNMRNGFIDFRVAAIATVFELAGVMIGHAVAESVEVRLPPVTVF